VHHGPEPSVLKGAGKYGGIEEAHPQPEEVQAILAPEIPDSEGGTKSEEPRQASVPDLLVTKAKQTGATVTFVEDRSLLESIGGVGAFLRFLRLFGVASSLDVPNRGELSLGERLLAPPQFRNGEWLVRAQSRKPLRSRTVSRVFSKMNAVDFENSFNLSEETVQQAEVAIRYSDDRRDGLRVQRELGKRDAARHPPPVQQSSNRSGIQGPKLMDDSDRNRTAGTVPVRHRLRVHRPVGIENYRETLAIRHPRSG